MDIMAEATHAAPLRLDDLLKAIETKAPFPMVKRPGYGSQGKTVEVTSNLFRVGYSRLKEKIYQYDVRFTTEDKANEDLFSLKKHRELRIQIFESLIENHWKEAYPDITPAWDGNKQLLTVKELYIEESMEGRNPEKRFSVELSVSKRGGEGEGESRVKRSKRAFLVAIKLVKTLKTSLLGELLSGSFASVHDPREIMQALDIVMAYRLPSRLINHGRNFYDPNKHKSTGAGSQMLSGLFQSLKPAERRCYLNMDISAGLFVEEINAVDLLREHLNARDARGISDFEPEAIRRVLKPFMLTVNYRTRSMFKAKTITSRGAKSTMFDFDGRQVSVADYFEKEKDKKLKYPELPCIELSIKRGSDTFIEYLPLELVTVVGRRRWPCKATQSHIDQIRKAIATKPPQRSKSICDALRDTIDFRSESVLDKHKLRILEEFGLTLSRDPAKLDARMLDLPVLEFKDRGGERVREVRPQGGAWNVRDTRLMEGRDVESWAIFSFTRRMTKGTVQTFAEKMAQSYKEKTGNYMDRRPIIMFASEMRCDRGKETEELFRELSRQVKDDRVDVIFCIIEDTDSHTYHGVKRISELTYGYITQCVKESRASQAKPPVLENICLKLNAKLGCLNCTIPQVHKQLVKKPTLVLGGDISHGGAGSTSPSVCALVGTIDRYMQQLSASLSVQPLLSSHTEEGMETRMVRQEEIVDMKRMVKERIDEFVRGCKRAPTAILYYRDGVADSQFESVITKELKEIRDAVRELAVEHPDWWKREDMPDPVKLTAIIHQKRHHVRFFPGPGTPTDRSGNCSPGTVVDSKCGHPYGYDFWLLSHAGIQGCSRPSYYRVILDENNHGPDWIQKVTFDLCHLYASCTRSISGVPVCFYADRLALRTRDYLYEQFGSDQASVVSDRSGGRDDRFRAAALHPRLKDKFFFA